MVSANELPILHGSAADSFAYYGTRAGWRIGLSVHRDSDALERSNWRVIAPPMVAEYGDDCAIERMGHWAVGWTDYLLVRPDSSAEAAMVGWLDRLADYPVADEDDYSALESAEEWCTRCDRGTREEHPLNGCRFRSADDAEDIRARWSARYSARYSAGVARCAV